MPTLSGPVVLVVGWGTTVAEVAPAVALVAGIGLRAAAIPVGALLASFARAMAFALGPEPPLFPVGGGRGLRAGLGSVRHARGPGPTGVS